MSSKSRKATQLQVLQRCREAFFFFFAYIYTHTFPCAAVTVIHYTCSKVTNSPTNLQATSLPLIGVRCGTESSSGLCLLFRCTSRGGGTLTRFRGRVCVCRIEVGGMSRWQAQCSFPCWLNTFYLKTFYLNLLSLLIYICILNVFFCWDYFFPSFFLFFL